MPTLTLIRKLNLGSDFADSNSNMKTLIGNPYLGPRGGVSSTPHNHHHRGVGDQAPQGPPLMLVNNPVKEQAPAAPSGANRATPVEHQAPQAQNEAPLSSEMGEGQAPQAPQEPLLVRNEPPLSSIRRLRPKMKHPSRTKWVGVRPRGPCRCEMSHPCRGSGAPGPELSTPPERNWGC